jgi:hypothetical protein
MAHKDGYLDNDSLPTSGVAVSDRDSQAQAFLVARYVLMQLATQLTGYTVKAMQRKIERGDWVEGKVWKRAPDGRILIDIVGFQKWVEGQ